MTGTLTVQVYLNDSRDGFLGFHNKYSPAELRKAIEFDTPVPPGPRPAETLLETIFEQLNIGGDLIPADEYTTAYRAAGNRSLSVGDVVILGETAYAVDRVGWKRITTDELIAAQG